jgi:hypothetical protein
MGGILPFLGIGKGKPFTRRKDQESAEYDTPAQA